MTYQTYNSVHTNVFAWDQVSVWRNWSNARDSWHVSYGASDVVRRNDPPPRTTFGPFEEGELVELVTVYHGQPPGRYVGRVDPSIGPAASGNAGGRLVPIRWIERPAEYFGDGWHYHDRFRSLCPRKETP